MEKRPPAKVGVLKNNPLSNFVIQPNKKKRTILRATELNLQIKRDHNFKALYRLIKNVVTSSNVQNQRIIILMPSMTENGCLFRIKKNRMILH